MKHFSYCSPIVHMNHMKPIFMIYLFIAPRRYQKKHNKCCHFRHGGWIHFLVLAQTLINRDTETHSRTSRGNKHKETIWHIDTATHNTHNRTSRGHRHNKTMRYRDTVTQRQTLGTVKDTHTRRHWDTEMQWHSTHNKTSRINIDKKIMRHRGIEIQIHLVRSIEES